ncbi:unnamed protein product [Miscanthus lutarioriparius]|uniref:SEC63 domain-containing protein n=1 Tax=Miscanthus lutarioriparius TaxID=422564 RepID=A0A811NDK0_9POAL|nr:unnamed protein product [Miscanthus lutarioriparius]
MAGWLLLVSPHSVVACRFVPRNAFASPWTSPVGQPWWWLVIGDSSTNQLLAIKRVALQKRARVKLASSAPAEAGRKDYMIYLMSDSYLGCDQEYEFTVDAKDAGGD